MRFGRKVFPTKIADEGLDTSMAIHVIEQVALASERIMRAERTLVLELTIMTSAMSLQLAFRHE